jgi:hypothetical protein
MCTALLSIASAIFFIYMIRTLFPIPKRRFLGYEMLESIEEVVRTNKMGYSDFRSDSVCKPNVRMRQAMAHSIVGDDIYGDDPTTNLLQNQIAKICGKEASLFVPTGT